MKGFKTNFDDDEKLSIGVAVLSSLDFFPGDTVLTITKQQGRLEDAFFRSLGCFVDIAGGYKRKSAPDFSANPRLNYLDESIFQLNGGTYSRIVVFDTVKDVAQGAVSKLASMLDDEGIIVFVETTDFDFDADTLRADLKDIKIESEIYNGSFYVLIGRKM